jgi:hypothetical protein
MLPIRLNTYRYPGGYQVVGEVAPDVLIADASSREPLVLDKPDLEDPIFVRLLNCRTDDDFIRFANRFFDELLVGIGDASDPDGRVMINLPSLATQLRLAMFVEVMGDSRRNRGNSLVDGLLEHVRLRTTVVDGTRRLVVEAVSVRDFMALEVASACEAGAKMTGCSHCDKVFLFGPCTGRRSHGKYCSDRCRVAAMRARNATRRVDEK